MSEMGFMTPSDGEGDLNKASREIVTALRAAGCSLSSHEIFPLLFRIFVIGAVGGAAAQADDNPEASVKS